MTSRVCGKDQTRSSFIRPGSPSGWTRARSALWPILDKWVMLIGPDQSRQITSIGLISTHLNFIPLISTHFNSCHVAVKFITYRLKCITSSPSWIISVLSMAASIGLVRVTHSIVRISWLPLSQHFFALSWNSSRSSGLSSARIPSLSLQNKDRTSHMSPFYGFFANKYNCELIQRMTIKTAFLLLLERLEVESNKKLELVSMKVEKGKNTISLSLLNT